MQFDSRNIPQDCIKRHMLSDRDCDQIDYKELNLTEDDSVCEYSGPSELGLAWSSSCSKLAQYLTKKGAGIDSSIQWGRLTLASDANPTCQKRPRESEVEVASKKRCRRASMGDLVADIQTVREMLQASISNNPQKQDEEVFLTVAGSVETVHSMLSLTAEAGLSLNNPAETLESRSNQFTSSNSGEPQSNCSQSKIEPNLFQIHSGEASYLDDIFSSIQSIASTRSSASRSGSMRLSTHTAPEVTVLFIDIKGFTAECAAMPAGRVGEWVAAFYERVDDAAARHGVSKVEVRGDCCICVSGAEGRVPSRAVAARAEEDRRGDQATRMLAFAAALHADLATLPGGTGGATAARMGVATGDVALLVNAAGGWEAAPCACVRGEAAEIAARLEAWAAPGRVYVHRSTAERWAAEAGRAPPATGPVECEAQGAEAAAVYDCVALHLPYGRRWAGRGVASVRGCGRGQGSGAAARAGPQGGGAAAEGQRVILTV